MDIYELVVMASEHLKEGISGFAGTFAAWVFFFIIWAPRISFSGKLKPIENHHATHLSSYHDRLRVGIANRSHSLFGLLKHEVYDVKVNARLEFLEGLTGNEISDNSDNTKWRRVYFDVPFENGESRYEIPILKTNYSKFTYIGLLHRDIEKFGYANIFPGRDKSEITLQDILGLKEAKISIIVTARDKYTGNEKTLFQEYVLSENKKEVIRISS